MSTWTPATILALKKELGLSYVEIAKECGVTDRTARYWTSRKRAVEPSGSAQLHLDRLARRNMNRTRT